MKNYITIQEIMDIFKISQQVSVTILKNHKIDVYKGKNWLMVNFKDFHKAYTNSYNPTLFEVYDKKQKTNKIINKKLEKIIIEFWEIDWLFETIFTKPYKNEVKKVSNKTKPRLF